MPAPPDLSALTRDELSARKVAPSAAIAGQHDHGAVGPDLGGQSRSDVARVNTRGQPVGVDHDPLHTGVWISDGRDRAASAQAETSWWCLARLVLGLPHLAVAAIVLVWWKLTLRHARGEETLGEAALGAGLIFLITWLALLYTGDV